MNSENTKTSDILIAGAGPTGLMLAGELGAAGVATTLVERRTDQESNLTRPFAVQARAMEMFDACGIADELVVSGTQIHYFRLFSHVYVDLSILPGRFPYVLVTPRYETERALRERAESAGVEILTGTELTALHQDDQYVEVELRNGGGTSKRSARYVAGTDGAHSTVRQTCTGVSAISGIEEKVIFVRPDGYIGWAFER